MWLIFFVSVFFSQIVVFNMLIAIMGDTYDRVAEIKKQHGLRLGISDSDLGLGTQTWDF